MAKVGDTVRFLSTTGGGRVVKIDGQIAHVEEDDGFVTPVLLKERSEEHTSELQSQR